MSVSQLQAGADVGARAGWRRVSLPSLGLAGVTAAVLWAAVAELLQQGRLATVLSAGRAELAAPLLVALVIVTGICERAWPAERHAVLARGHVQDACFVALHAIVVIPLMTLLSVGAAALIGGHASWIELRAARDWPGWLIVPLTVVAMDGANWLAHYADHRLDFLWRFHALHHSQEELSVLTSFRAHPLMHTTGFLLAAVPVAILMPTRPIAPVVITVYVCVGTLQHANLRWTFGPRGPGGGEPGLPPAAPRARHPAGQPRCRADHLGRPGRPGQVPGPPQAAGPTGLAGRPVPVEQDACAASALVLMAGQLIEPFTAARPGSGS